MKQLYKNTYLLYAFLGGLLVTFIGQAQTPNSWTQKADLGLSTPNGPMQRFGGVSFSIDSKGYFGTGTYQSYEKDFWEYDPATDTWTQKADFGGSARQNAAGFSVNGKGYIGTGYDGSFKKDFWEYNPSTNAWTQKADFGGVQRAEAVGFSINGKGYLGTGDSGSARKDFWEYDPNTDRWTQKADYAEERYQAVGFSMGGKGYIGTGRIGFTYKNDFWEYNPTTNTWTKKADFAGGGRRNAVGLSINGKGYIGTGSDGSYKNDFWEYNLSSDTWVQKVNFGGAPRFLASGFSIGDKGYLGMGTGNTNIKDFWEFNPVSNSWASKAPFGGTALLDGVGFSVGNKGYITLGDDGRLMKFLWEYDPADDTWRQKADFAGEWRQGAVGFGINDKGYVGTGSSVTQKKDFWEYNPSTNSWTQKADFGGSARSYAVGFSINGKGYIGTGTDGNNTKDFWEYNPSNNSWVQKADFGGLARLQAVGFNIGNKGYIGTGLAAGATQKDFWEYDPSTNRWTQKTDLGGDARLNAVGFGIGSRGYIGTGNIGNISDDFWEFDPVSNSWSKKTNVGGTPRTVAVGFSIGGKGYIGTGLFENLRRKDFWEYTPPCYLAASISPNTPLTVCSGGTLTLNGSSTGGYTPTYSWSAGGGAFTSTQQNPTFTIPTVTSSTNYTITLTVSENGCTATATVGVRVDPVSVGGTVNSNQTICSGTAPANLSLSGQVGNVVRWDRATNSSFSSWNTISSTSTTLTGAMIGSLTADTYFRAIVKSGGCIEATSSVVKITVSPVSVGGSIGGSATVCAGTNRTDLALSGQVGAIQKWQSSLRADFSETTDIANTTTELAATNLTQTTYLRAFVKSGVCSEATSTVATVTVNPLPTATITGGTTVCKNATSPKITFTGAAGTAPYTFTYKINNGSEQTITTTNGNSVSLDVPTSEAGTFDYSLVSVKDGSSTTCSQAQSGSTTMTVNPLPTATITGGTTVCKNASSPKITFTGAAGTVPYTFTYKINNGSEQTITTTNGSSVSLDAPTSEAGTFEYSLVSVKDGSSTTCSQAQTGSTTVTVNPLPTATITGGTVVCKNATPPKVTFTGAAGTAPYTFTYKINNGSEQTITTTNGNSVSLDVPTSEAGTFEYSLVSVKDGSSTTCSQAQTGSATVTVNPLPTATITGGTVVCKNASSPKITFTGAAGTAPYTFTYKINSGSEQTITTTNGNSVNLDAPTSEAGTFEYSLVSVKDGSSTTCSQAQTGSTTVTVNPLPTATITGGTMVCKNASSPKITFTGAAGTAPYTFTYKINNGSEQTITTTNGNSVSLDAPTSEAGTFEYSLVSVKDGSSTTCSQTQSGSTAVTVNPLPTATITGGTVVCKNASSPKITFTGAAGTAPYTFTYKINNGSEQTITTTNGNSVSLDVPTSEAGTFEYSLVSVKDGSSTTCSQAQSGSTAVTVNPLPTATITGGTTVCKNASLPKITFTGAAGTAPYTFTYKINNGSEQTITTTNGNSVSLDVPTSESGTFEYSLVSVKDGSSTMCSQAQSGSTAVTMNPLPTATITGGTVVCKNATSPKITFTGAAGTAPYTFTYKINNGSEQTITTTNGNSVSLDVPTSESGTFEYSLVSVKDGSSTMCSQAQSGSTAVTVNPLPTATITGGTVVCKNASSPKITFTGAAGTAPYTFTYKINNGSEQAITTTNGNSVNLDAPTSEAGTFEYSLVSVKDGSSTTCSQAQSGSTTVTVQDKPTITLSTLQQTLNEGNSQTFCDTDANPVNGLQFAVSGSCVTGSPVWRVQVGSGAWSGWASNPPVTQLSNNQPHRYQAACDASCPVTYTNAIELMINYRASTPQNVSMVADGVSVNAGESKDVCNIEGNVITFNATCGAGEMLLYSVDGGEYSSVVPMQLVDGQYHNYRVRCRNSDGTTSCVESESGVMRLRITIVPVSPVASLNVTSGCGNPVAFNGTANCGAATTIWYNATTNVALPTFPTQTPTETSSYYARCQAGGGCLSEKSNVVTYTAIQVGVAPVVTASAEVVCTGVEVTLSTSCPTGTTPNWNTGTSENSFKVSFLNVTKQSYWVRCMHPNGCQSVESGKKEIYWKAFELTLINIGESKSAIKTNDRSVWSSQFITRDGGPELEQSTQQNPTLYYVENANKVAPRYWTINVDACALGTNGSLTFDMLATPETGVPQSFNTHENNAPYFMYANRDGWTELYAQNHPAYGFYQDNGAGANVYDAGLPKGLYKLGVRYWDQKGWGSIYPSTRKPQGNVLAYQEYWFRIQSKDGVGVGAARTAESGGQEGASGNKQRATSKGQGSDNGQQLTDNGAFATVLPNPVTNVLRLKVQESKGQVVQTSLMDASGRRILERRFTPETNTHQEEFGVSELPTGIYFLQVQTHTKQAVLRVLKTEE